MYVVYLETQQHDGTWFAVPTKGQSAKIPKAMDMAYRVAKRMPRSIKVTVRHHRTNDLQMSYTGEL